MAACFSPYAGEDGILTINLGGSGARAASKPWPPTDAGILNNLDYKVTLFSPRGSREISPKGGGSLTVKNVFPGMYDIVVEAHYLGDLYARGFASAEIKAGINNAVTITVGQWHIALLPQSVSAEGFQEIFSGQPVSLRFV